MIRAIIDLHDHFFSNFLYVPSIIESLEGFESAELRVVLFLHDSFF